MTPEFVISKLANFVVFFFVKVVKQIHIVLSKSSHGITIISVIIQRGLNSD